MKNIFPLAMPFPDMKSFKCPHCYCLSIMQKRTVSFSDDPTVIVEGNKRYEAGVIVDRCENCGGKIVWVDSHYVYPDFPPEPANPDMPRSIRELYDEAGMIFRKSPRAACALLRLAVERLCNELGECKQSLNENIASLSEKGLSNDIIKQLDILRVVENKAVHPGYINLDIDSSEVAFQLMCVLNKLIDRLITDRKQIDFLYAKLPDNQRRIKE